MDKKTFMLAVASPLVTLITAMAILYSNHQGFSHLNESNAVIREDVAVLKTDVSGLKEDVSILQQDFFGLNEKVDRLFIWASQTVVFLRGKFGEAFPGIDSRLVGTGRSNSLATLNAKGRALADQLDVHGFVDKYHNRIAVPADADEYAIQEICFAFVGTQLLAVATREERRAIAGSFRKDGYSDVIFVYAVLFRDYFLKQRGFELPAHAE